MLWLPIALAACEPLQSEPPPATEAADRGLEAMAPAGAIQGRRVALVVGNEAYAHATPLAQARSDARGVASALAELGFQVTTQMDADKGELMRALGDFRDAVAQAEVAFFYYAGHAVQIGGQNYILPVDARMAKPSHADADAVDARLVLNAMDQAASRLNVVVLDACRNNPFETSWSQLGGGTRGFTPGGLGTMTAPSDTFLMAFATAPGDVAADDGRYASELVAHLKQPCLNMMEAFGEVSARVSSGTESAQRPWTNSTGNAAFRFYPAGCDRADAAVEVPPAQPLAAERGSGAAVASTGGAEVGSKEAFDIGDAVAQVAAKRTGTTVMDAEPQIKGDYAPANVIRGMARLGRSFQDCYDRALARNPDVGGEITLGIEVEEDGRITDTRVTRQTIPDKLMGECVLGRTKRLELKPPGELTYVEYTLRFVPGSAAAAE